MMTAYAEFQQGNLIGFVSDELAIRRSWIVCWDGQMLAAYQAALVGYMHPQTFLGIGGMKVFRDDIWGPLRIVFPADHRAYKRIGFTKPFHSAIGAYAC
jgi:hypothetical protein